MAVKITSKEYFEKAQKGLNKALPKANNFGLPKIDKIVINAGVGKFEKSEIEEISDNLEKLTGQKPKHTSSKLSIAGFKLRAGETIGLTITLRGDKARDFLFNLVYLGLPRTKDFKGLKSQAFTEDYSCFSIGIPNASIFPQIGFAVKTTFGLQVNVCFKEKTENNKILLEKLSFPFKK